MTREQENQLKFLKTHTQNNGRMAALCLCRMGDHLKRVRVDRVYLNAGYAKFEEYIEHVLGLDPKVAKALVHTYETCGDAMQKHSGEGWRGCLWVFSSYLSNDGGADVCDM